MKCKFHPDREAIAVCEKFGVGYCTVCCAGSAATGNCGCSSPRQHCAYRTRCLVWELSRQGPRGQRSRSEETNSK